jgi:hypothetical protein
MKRTSATNDRPAGRKAADWSRAVRGKYAASLADKRWWVKLDPDLVELLSGEGDPATHLLGLARRRRGKRERIVVVIPMSDRDYSVVRELLARIGAEVRYVPHHPNSIPVSSAKPRRRKAG